jgi:hypothetical protein
MDSTWPWLAVAGLGALHGLNPASGWLFSACSVRAGQRHGWLRTLIPIALGHVASVALVAGAVPAAWRLGWAIDSAALLGAAIALMLALVSHHFVGLARKRSRPVAGPVPLTLWSFAMATAHGAGLILVPALIPLCTSDMPAREITASGSLTLALAAVAVHLAAMLVVTALTARCARPAIELARGWLRNRRKQRGVAPTRLPAHGGHRRV